MGRAAAGIVAAAVAAAAVAACPAAWRPGLATDGAAAEAPEGASPEALSAAEAALWERLRDRGRAEEVEAFLVLFPRSRFAAEARRRRDELAAEAPSRKPPPAPAQGAAPPNLPAAASAAAVAPECGLLSAAADETSVTLAGVVRRGQERLVQSMLDAFGVPAGAARLRLEPFEGPYCGALAAVLANVVTPPPDAPPRLALLDAPPLPEGGRLRFRVEMPAWPAHLSAFYLAVSGEAASLVVDAQPRPAGAASVLEDPRWKIAAPFGTDLLLVVASEQPLFERRRPTVEKLEEFTPALSAALGRARRAGGRVAARAAVVETAAR